MKLRVLKCAIIRCVILSVFFGIQCNLDEQWFWWVLLTFLPYLCIMEVKELNWENVIAVLQNVHESDLKKDIIILNLVDEL